MALEELKEFIYENCTEHSKTSRKENDSRLKGERLRQVAKSLSNKMPELTKSIVLNQKDFLIHLKKILSFFQSFLENHKLLNN